MNTLKEAVIIIPITKDSNRTDVVLGVTATAIDWLTEAFGGCTSVQGTGAWRGSDGKTQHEPVTILTVALDTSKPHMKTLNRVVTLVGSCLKQDCVYFKEPQSGKVRLVHTKHLWSPPEPLPAPEVTAPVIAAE